MAAEDELASGASQIVGNVAQGAYYILIVLMLLAIVGAVVFMVMWFLKHKHRIIIRSLAKGRKLIIYDRAREYIDKSGVKYWKLLWSKHIIPVPPPEAVELTRKGKLYVEAYRTENDQYWYLEDNAEFDSGNPSLKPITTNQRASVANQIRKKFDRKTHKWTEYIPQIASGVMIIFVFAMILIFWEDVTNPSIKAMEQLKEMMQEQTKYMEEQRKTQELINEILLDKQILKDEVDTQNIPLYVPPK